MLRSWPPFNSILQRVYKIALLYKKLLLKLSFSNSVNLTRFFTWNRFCWISFDILPISQSPGSLWSLSKSIKNLFNVLYINERNEKNLISNVEKYYSKIKNKYNSLKAFKYLLNLNVRIKYLYRNINYFIIGLKKYSTFSTP